MVITNRKINPIYLDYNSTTPVDERVFEAMAPYFTKNFGNPSSKTHPYGWNTELAVENARKIIASSLHASPKEILFTSGGTESNNLALIGSLKPLLKYKSPSEIHIISSPTEHSSVRNTLKHLKTQGFDVTILECDPYGRVHLDQIKKALKPTTALVSLIYANNEIGTLNPIPEIGSFLSKQGILFHTDAVQAYGQIPLNIQTMGVDLMTLTAHKIYGPKGISALFIRETPKKVLIEPALFGGGQEKDLRPGTLNVPAIVGFGKAVEIFQNELKEQKERILALRDEMVLKLLELSFVQLNGHPLERLSNNINLTFEGIKNSDLISELKDLAFSTGSACASGTPDPSVVLKAIGLSDTQCSSTIRIGLGRMTTEEEVQYATRRIREVAINLRERKHYLTI